MSANEDLRDNELVESAVSWLRQRLPAAWKVETRDTDGHVAIEIQGSGRYATLALEINRAFGPRDVDRMLGSAGRKLRALAPNIEILVVAPWLSPRTRDLLDQEGMHYLDLTGNALIRLDNPAVFIRTDGSARDPSPTPRGKARVRGPKAGRLIRCLADIRPPYGVRELAAATRLTAGYVSRLLDALDDDALIERSRRGRVEHVEVEGLIRRWAETYDVFATNESRTYLASRGAADALTRLADPTPANRVAVTGSFAAVRYAPVSRPSLLCAYVDDATAVAGALELIPADEGANVVLLQPFDPVAWSRTANEDGIAYVAPSQAAVDCLTGNGRMPAEGEALLDWMRANEPRWRAASLVGAEQ
jgi:hypothetical protein